MVLLLSCCCRCLCLLCDAHTRPVVDVCRVPQTEKLGSIVVLIALRSVGEEDGVYEIGWLRGIESDDKDELESSDGGGSIMKGEEKRGNN